MEGNLHLSSDKGMNISYIMRLHSRTVIEIHGFQGLT